MEFKFYFIFFEIVQKPLWTMADSDEQILQFAILKYIKQKAEQSGGAENLEIALQCLQTGFGLNLTDSEHLKKYSVDVDLKSLIKIALSKASQLNSKPEASTPAQVRGSRSMNIDVLIP